MIPWSVPRGAWAAASVYIVAGGPSVETQDLSLLAGRRVIMVNSSYERLLKLVPPPHLPHADYLVFGDERWWRQHQSKVVDLPCPIITTGFEKSDSWQGLERTLTNVLRLNNSRPQQKTSPPVPLRLSDDPSAVPLRRTSATAAMNIAYLLNGGAPLILLGMDGKIDADGRGEHHKPHPWDRRSTCWYEQRQDLEGIAADLSARDVSVINASPGSALHLWPAMDLPAAIEQAERRMAA